MARMRFRRSYNFDSATRQLDSRDLDDAGDPATDMGSAMEALLSQYGALDLQPAYPGLDIMFGDISGSLSLLGEDFGDLAAEMARADGYDVYPAEGMPALGAWTSPHSRAVKWTPTEPGIYQWYATTKVNLSTAPDPATIIAMSDPFPDVMAEAYGTDNNTVVNLDVVGGIYQRSVQGMLMASPEMLDAGFGGLLFYTPYYSIQGAEQVALNALYFSVVSWSPGGTVPYLGGI